MSDLIERVRDVLVKNESETFKDQACAVVLAVLEHYSEAGNVSNEMEGAAGKRATKKNIAAALRAAAGSAPTHRR